MLSAVAATATGAMPLQPAMGETAMPYEVIQYPNTSPNDSGTEITVHWSKESHVQLEVVRHIWGHVCPNGCDGINTGCSECPRGTVDEFHKGKDLGAPVIVGTVLTAERTAPAVTDGDPEQMPVASDLPAQIWTQILTRQEINKMIRVLRRARDQAYGEDA